MNMELNNQNNAACRKISAVIITKNEEKNIASAVNSVKWCDEVLVVDSGSADKTVQTARALGCRVLFNEFKGYGEQKQYAVSEASNDWIVSVDADEVFSDELRGEVTDYLKKEECPYAGFNVKIRLVFFNKKLRHGGTYCARKLRVFNRKYGNFNNNKVHEYAEVKGKIKNLKGEILHYSYKNIFEFIQKLNTYTELGASSASAENKIPSVLKIIFRSPFEFIKRYFFQLGLLDGFPGFVWAFLGSFSPAVKYIKIIEKSRKNLK